MKLKPFPTEFYAKYLPNDLDSLKVALARYAQMCRKCGRDKGLADPNHPCPYCHGTGKQQEVKVEYTKIEPARLAKTYESESTPGLTYQVYATKSGVFSHCTCPGYFYRKDCKHKADFLKPKKKGKRCTPSN